MRIEALKIKNFKVFKDVTVSNLPSLCVFVGVNGSGKTTLFDVFSFLKDALRDNVTVAVNRRGGFRELISRGCDPEKDSIEIEIRFRLSNPEPVSSLTYFVAFGLINDAITVKKEQVFVHFYGKETAENHLNYSEGVGFFLDNPQKLDLKYKDILAVKALSFFKESIFLQAISSYLSTVYISTFQAETLRISANNSDTKSLSNTGDNLARVARYTYVYRQSVFEKILTKLTKLIPGIDAVEARETEDGRIVLRFNDKNFQDPFSATFISDGTMKLFAYLLLLNESESPNLLCLEEPEQDFYPNLLPYLVEEIREHTEQWDCQIFVSTHSPEFVDAVQLNELFYMVKQDGFSIIRAAADDPVVSELAKDNSLGWLWRNNYLQANSL